MNPAFLGRYSREREGVAFESPSLFIQPGFCDGKCRIMHEPVHTHSGEVAWSPCTFRRQSVTQNMLTRLHVRLQITRKGETCLTEKDTSEQKITSTSAITISPTRFLGSGRAHCKSENRNQLQVPQKNSLTVKTSIRGRGAWEDFRGAASYTF